LSWPEDPDEPVEAGVESAPEDPLAALDENIRNAVQSRIQQESDAAAEAARQEVLRTQSQKDGRHGNTVRQMAQFGLTVDPQTGNVIAQDPQALLLAAGRFSAQTQPEPVDEEPEPYETEKYRDWTKRQVAQAVEAAQAPLLKGIQELQQLMTQTTFSNAPRPQDLARQTLAEYGQDGLADTQEFQSALSEILATATPTQLAQPGTVRMATLMAMDTARQSGAKPPTPPAAPAQPAVNPAVAAQQAARAGIGQVNVSAGHSAPPRDVPREQRLAQTLEQITGRKISKATFEQATKQPFGPMNAGRR
jgi:hypothetical protein